MWVQHTDDQKPKKKSSMKGENVVVYARENRNEDIT